MTKHTLRSTQTVAADPDRVWRFFSNAANLGRITPRSMDFAIHTPEPSTEEGATIDYTVRPLFGIPARWQSLIEDVSAPNRFRDVQVNGPYKSWIHEHRFEERDGQTVCSDRIDYASRGGPLIHRFLVRPDIERIFDYRTMVLGEIFKAIPAAPSALP